MSASVPERVAASELHQIRRDILRRGTPTDDVEFPTDADLATVHLAVRDGDGAVIAAASWNEAECPEHPGRRALQLRGMAVADTHRRCGLGVILVEAGVALAVRREIGLLWANARDTALDFYLRQGFSVVGAGFLTADTQLPHHRVVRQL